MNKAVFLDRDGVLNIDDPNYSFQVSKFKVIPGVPEALLKLREAGFYLVVVTNQSGINKGIYTREQMDCCHIYLQNCCDHVIDAFYFSPYHRTITKSLATKPGTLMFEKAIARFGIAPHRSWMIGDRGRDLVPARALGIKTIQVGDEVEQEHRGDYKVENLTEAAEVILQHATRNVTRLSRWRMQ